MALQHALKPVFYQITRTWLQWGCRFGRNGISWHKLVYNRCKSVLWGGQIVSNVGDRATKRIRWIARTWGTLLVAFTLLVFTGYAWNWLTTGEADPHAADDYPPIENVPPLLGFLSVLGLAIAWRWEGLGAAIAIGSNLAGLPVLLVHWPITHDFPRYLVAPYGIWMAIAIPGILFLICWWRSKPSAISPQSA